MAAAYASDLGFGQMTTLGTFFDGALWPLLLDFVWEIGQKWETRKQSPCPWQFMR